MTSEIIQERIPTCILTAHGVHPTPYEASSLAEVAAKEPNGVYTVGRTFRRDHTLLLDDHLDRLEQSAHLVGITIRLDRPALRKALRGLIEQTDYADSRFRITIPHDQPDSLYLAIARYEGVPPDIVQHGARCVTVSIQRTNPAAKTTEWVHQRQASIEALPIGVYEGLLTNEAGAILEGMSSNFYAVMDGELRTASEGVLAGIAQRIVLKIAPEVIALRPLPITIRDLPFVEEAFITSAGRGVVPVIMINQQVIGAGEPGKLTLAIRALYEAYTEANVTPL